MYIPSGELVIILKDNKIFITICKLFKSLNFRLFVTFFVLGWIPALIVSNVFLNAYYERAIAVRTTDVQNQCKIISNQIVSSDYLNSNTSDTILGELSLISSLYDGRRQFSAVFEFTVEVKDTGQVFFTIGVDDVGRRGATTSVHAHVQTGIVAK